MALSGSQGFVGIATQGPTLTNMNTAPADGAYEYIEAMAAPFRVNDVTRTRRPTIGAKPLPRNAYKVGTSVQAAIGFEATTNIAGKMLTMLMGHADAPVEDGEVHTHIVRMAEANQYQIPYFALRRGVGTQILETALGCKIGRGVMNFAAGDALQMSFDIQGRVPSFDAAPPGTITYDESPILTVVGGDLEIETASGVFTGASGGVISLGASIEWGNMLTGPDRYRIGSPYVIDWTLLDRVATVTLQMELNDDALYKKVYYAGGTVWDPTPWIGGFWVKAVSAETPLATAGAVATPHSIKATANTLNFQAMLVANEPQRVVEATLVAQLLKSEDDGAEPLEFEIVTDRATAFA